MPFTVAEFGGLAAAFAPTTERRVNEELQRLDRFLFLDKELEPYGPHGPYVYLVVKHHIGSGVPPVPVLEWRDRDGPWPLTMEIVERVKRREGRLEDAVAKAVAANERKRQQTVEKVGDEAYEVALDARKATGKTSAVLPRSQALRRSRDRQRARGNKV